MFLRMMQDTSDMWIMKMAAMEAPCLHNIDAYQAFLAFEPCQARIMRIADLHFLLE